MKQTSESSFIEEVERISQTSRQCGYLKVREQLDAADAAALEKVIFDAQYNANAISKALKNRGFDIGDYPIRQHRKKECSCFRRKK